MRIWKCLTVAASLLAAVVYFAGAARVQAQEPRYLLALSDLRTARDYIKSDHRHEFEHERHFAVDEINKAMEHASKQQLKGILAVTHEPLVSMDFNHNPASSTFDMTGTQIVDGKLVRVLSWYDNEWGFSNRMSDTAAAMGKLL